MVCSLCGKEGAKVRRITRTFGRGEKMFVVENLPVEYCPHCYGEVMTSETIQRLEFIRKHRDQETQLKSIAVAVM